MRKSVFSLFALTLMVASLSGCGIIDYFYLPPSEDTAQELFENGNDAMAEKDYMSAVEYYTKLRDEYPSSPYTLEAEISLGDAYFLDEEYILAAEAYKDFEDMHPRHEAIPYVLNQIALSDMKSYRSIDRPATALVEAVSYLERVQESYPDTEYATRAAELIHACRIQIAQHELYIADFYDRTGRYGAAWRRYAYVAENYSDLEEEYAYAEQQGKLVYIKYLEDQSLEERRKQEGSWKDYFDWL